MPFPVYAAGPHCANPSLDQPLYHESWSRIQKLLDSGTAFRISMFDKREGVQLCKAAPTSQQLEDYGCAEAVKTLSNRGNLIAFALGAQGKIGKPDSINYPIPCVGARNRPQWCQNSILYAEAKFENRQREAIAL